MTSRLGVLLLLAAGVADAQATVPQFSAPAALAGDAARKTSVIVVDPPLTFARDAATGFLHLGVEFNAGPAFDPPLKSITAPDGTTHVGVQPVLSAVVMIDGRVIGTRPQIKFISGPGVLLTATDDGVATYIEISAPRPPPGVPAGPVECTIGIENVTAGGWLYVCAADATSSTNYRWARTPLVTWTADAAPAKAP